MYGFLYFIGYFYVIMLPLGVYLGGWWTWMIILVSFTMNPLLDVVFDSEDYNPTSKEAKLLSRAPIYLLHTWCWFPVHLAALVYSAYYICLGSSGTLSEISGVLASLILIAGTGGFLIAHELIHHQSKWEKGL
jgi:alkane 1-monooxygenase